MSPSAIVSEELKRSFPEPIPVWAGNQLARAWAYAFLAPLDGKVTLQLSGAGKDAIRFVLAGAARAFCLDPAPEVLRLGRQRADRYDLSSAIGFVRGIAERLPFPDDFFDAVHGGAVLHHTLLDQSTAEIYRVLKPGGRGSFFEPLEGSALFRWARLHLPYPGKGEEGVDYPMTYETVERFLASFDAGEYREFDLFGTPAKATIRLNKGFRRLQLALRPLDDFLIRKVPPLRRFSRIVAIRVEKRP